MNPSSPTVFIVFLRFGPNRAQAGQWMAGHKQWIQDGMADGSFLMAGSLEDAQGGLVVAAGTDAAAIHARVAQDPFVLHGVVTADIHAVAPSVMSQGLSELLASSGGAA
ncbi:YciI family protein [Hydrogenophaga sp. ZJX-1]|uniref:YciI family protein n=1 Tax=Hydrogenophaga sp. ZJX-1 TaxID=3404778 RepID=UPI003B27CBEE